MSANRQGPVNFVERDEIPDFFRVGADGSRTINTLFSYKNKVDKRMNIDISDINSYDLITSATKWVDFIMDGGCVTISGNTIHTNDNQGIIKKVLFLVLDLL